MLGIRNKLTKILDGYVSPELGDINDEYYYVYIFEKDGKPERFQDEFTYGWFLRIPGCTCANIHFDNKTKTFDHITFTDVKNHEVFDRKDELKELIERRYAGKTEEEVLTN